MRELGPPGPEPVARPVSSVQQLRSLLMKLGLLSSQGVGATEDTDVPEALRQVHAVMENQKRMPTAPCNESLASETT